MFLPDVMAIRSSPKVFHVHLDVIIVRRTKHTFEIAIFGFLLLLPVFCVEFFGLAAVKSLRHAKWETFNCAIFCVIDV